MNIRTMPKLMLCIAGCLLSCYAIAQEYSFRHYSSADGLPAQDVHNLEEDSNGFLWLGTGNGLSRFDGKNFKNYGYTEGLQNLTVLNILEDSHHRLWVGSSKGVTELRGNRFFHYKNEQLSQAWILSLGEYPDFGLLAFTDLGTFRYNDTDWVKINLPVPGEKNCIQMVQGSDGLYLAYENVLYFKRKDAEAVAIIRDTIGHGSNFCHELEVRNGRVYAAIINKLYECKDGRMRIVIDSIPTTEFYRFTVDADSVFWVSIIGKDLIKYQELSQGKISKTFYKYNSNTGGSPYVDHYGALWILSYEGLIKAIPKPFEDITPLKAVGIGKRLSVIAGVDEEVLLSSDSGIHIVKAHSIIRQPRPASYKDENSYLNDVVEGDAKDSRNFTWLITRQRKLFCWNGSKLLDYSAGMIPRNTDYIRNLGINPLNNTIFVCDDSTLLCGDERKFRVYADKNGKTFSRTSSVMFTTKGIGMVNVYSKGLYFITRNNEIVKAPSELDIVDKGNYTYFFEDPDGIIWISNAGKGLIHFRVDEQTYRVTDLKLITTEQGLPSNKVHDMAFDSEGGRWIACNNGLVVLKRDPANSREWNIYSIGKEQNIDLLYPVGLTANNKGTVWLTSLDKIIKVDTRNLTLKKVVPNVVIEKAMLNMKETSWLNYADSVSGYFQLPVSLVLDHSQNNMEIEFSGVSLYNADYFEYSYQLNPLDKSWSPPSSGKFISLVNLSPGKYIFKVRARAKGTHWSEPKLFSFMIRSPFWTSWWFYVIVAALFAAIVVMIFRSRVKKIQKEADVNNQLRELEMKALKAQMNPHFIYNALNSIQSLIADEKNSEAINYIGTFSRLLRQVLEHSDSNVITLENELLTLKLYIELESLRLNMNLDYNVTIDDDLLPENERVPPLILQPFVENALWHGLGRHTGPKRLAIFISQSSGYLLITIEDNGIGRANAAAFKKQFSTELYASKGIDITGKRLIDFNRSKDNPVEYHDLLDMNEVTVGTRVTIRIKRQPGQAVQ